MSDGGQRHNPMPAECLRVFAQSVYESGISEEDVVKMIKDNPLELLELPPLPAQTAVPVNGAGPDGPVAEGLKAEAASSQAGAV
jgi:hypothetical protein